MAIKRIADSSVNGNSFGNSPDQKELPKAPQKELPIPVRHKEELPILKGRPGRPEGHTDEFVDDILDTMLRDGVAPYGKTRQRYNYRTHVRLAERAEHLEQLGVRLHTTFSSRRFWREWSAKTNRPLNTAFYRKFA